MAAWKLLAGALRSRTGCPWLLLWPYCVAKSAWHNYVLASVSLLVDFKLDLQIPTHTNVATLCGTLLGCLRSLQLSLCARKKVCACDAANWQWSMTAGAVAWALLALSVC